MEEAEIKRIHTVAIVGLGLLGASLGMALAGKNIRRLGWARRHETRRWCVEHDVVDGCGDNLEATLREADLTILCLPIPVIVDFTVRHAREFKPGAIVTDIGSDKSVIVAAGEAALTPHGVHFVGSHPMAGTEKSGCEAAFPALYDNAEVFVAISENTNAEAADAVAKFWRLVGAAAVRRIEPAEHDKLVAHTSHISHLLALALTLTVLDCDDPAEEMLRYSGCATGFRDTSRIASSSPEMWREIIENNQPAVLDAARRCEAVYHEIIQTIADGDFARFEALFARGKQLRDDWLAYKAAQRLENR